MLFTPDGLVDNMEGEIKIENKFKGSVRPLMATDIPHLRPILESWLRFPAMTGELLTEEVRDTIEEIQKSLTHENNKQFFVAQSSDGAVVGMMGIQPLSWVMRPFAQTVHPAEIINAYVHFEERQGKGVGRALVKTIEDESKKQGFDELLLNSGPRYKETGWPFWQKTYGEPVGIIKNHYGPTRDAPVWRKVL